MTVLTELLDTPIRDPQGEEVARLHDLVVRSLVNGADDAAAPVATPLAVPLAAPDAESAPADIYPPVIGIVARMNARHGSRDVFVPWEKVEWMDTRGAKLATPALNLERFARRPGELVLRDSLFDRQVVDVEGRRVVRINDLDVREMGGVWRLVAVDVSFAGVLRRAGGSWLERRLGNIMKREDDTRSPLIDWAQVIPVADSGASEGGDLRLRVPRDRLDLLHPADLARVVEQMTPQQGAKFLSDFDDARAADTIEELEDEQQAHVLRAMDPERAADVLEEMEPDEATDALQSFSPEEAAELLGRMDPEEASEVQELLHYSEDSAGGLMTNDYVAVPVWATVGGVLTALRARARAAAHEEADPLPAALPEIYIVDDTPAAPEGEPAAESAPETAASDGAAPAVDAPRPAKPASAPVPLEAEGRLVGVLALRDLLLAYPETKLHEIMRTDPPVAGPGDSAREAARLIAEDDLVTLPVVDDAGRLLGIVTVDDAIDVILPNAWKKRLPRSYR
ncbi:MAG TPA: CBS domain-containing protein [Ktedonobacterales bacterium]|nr:CBS domain-containing protein [Ktedonobacterales bacterium]